MSQTYITAQLFKCHVTRGCPPKAYVPDIHHRTAVQMSCDQRGPSEGVCPRHTSPHSCFKCHVTRGCPPKAYVPDIHHRTAVQMSCDQRAPSEGVCPRHTSPHSCSMKA